MSNFEIPNTGDPLSLMAKNKTSTVEPLAAAVPFLALPAYIVAGYAVAVGVALALELVAEVQAGFAYTIKVVPQA